MSRVVFLDRDGTINVDYGYVHEIDKLEFLPGVSDALKKLQNAGFKLIIITNQSGIARGLFTWEEYKEFEGVLLNRLEKENVHIDKVYVCPHGPEDQCNCRKPAVGLFELAGKEFDIEWDKSYAIGDRERDLCICEHRPVEGILLGKAREESKYKALNDWKEICEYIVGI